MNLATLILIVSCLSVDEDMVQLSNGCICCTINDNLVEAVFNILSGKSQWITW